MGREVDSDALTVLNRVLGVAGSGGLGASKTELDDGALIQVIDVRPIVRRSRSLAGTTGIFFCYMQNVHGAADDEASTQDPYAPTGAIAPYPNPVPAHLEFTIITAALRRVSGVASVDGGIFTAPTAPMQGWGVDDSAAALVSNLGMPLGRWDSIVQVGGVGVGLTEAGDAQVLIRQRIRRGTALDFFTTSDGIVTVQLVMLCALMPIATGQDVYI